MPLEMNLWRVDGARLREIGISRLDREQRLEDWIVADPTVLGMELAVLARQVQTPFGGRIDVLALDCDANTVVLELKKGRTPREVLAQLLDYGSWVRDLAYADLDRISQQGQGKSLPEVFEAAFGAPIPEMAQGLSSRASQNFQGRIREPKRGLQIARCEDTGVPSLGVQPECGSGSHLRRRWPPPPPTASTTY